MTRPRKRPLLFSSSPGQFSFVAAVVLFGCVGILNGLRAEPLSLAPLIHAVKSYGMADSDDLLAGRGFFEAESDACQNAAYGS